MVQIKRCDTKFTIEQHMFGCFLCFCYFLFPFFFGFSNSWGPPRPYHWGSNNKNRWCQGYLATTLGWWPLGFQTFTVSRNALCFFECIFCQSCKVIKITTVLLSFSSLYFPKCCLRILFFIFLKCLKAVLWTLSSSNGTDGVNDELWSPNHNGKVFV